MSLRLRKCFTHHTRLYNRGTSGMYSIAFSSDGRRIKHFRACSLISRQTKFATWFFGEMERVWLVSLTHSLLKLRSLPSRGSLSLHLPCNTSILRQTGVNCTPRNH